MTEDLPDHLTRLSTITGDDVYHCQTCGGEGSTPEGVAHHEECPEVETLVTDGGEDRLYYATGASSSGVTGKVLHTRDDCEGLRDARQIGDCPASHPPRGQPCSICGAELQLGDDRDVATDGSGHTCDACGEAFRTLTKLRLHEKDDCQARATYAEIDPDGRDPGGQAAEGLLTCRECGRENLAGDYEQTPSFADGDYHLIVEFACSHCGFDNENRVVMTGVDRDDLDDLPPHLQPEDTEIATDGGHDYDRWVGEECPECEVEIELDNLRWNGWAWEHKNPEAHPQAGHHVITESYVTDGGYDHGIIGECTECEGQMIEEFVARGTDIGRIGLHCQDCGATGRIKYQLREENPWENPSVQEGVTDMDVVQLTWIDCPNCHGAGEVIGCIDDICHGKGRCIHGGNDPCPDCRGSGSVPRIVETDGGHPPGAAGGAAVPPPDYGPEDRRRWDGAGILQYRGMGDQDPGCTHSDGELPCPDCFFDGGDDDD